MSSPPNISTTCFPTGQMIMPDVQNIAGLPLNITTYITPAEESLYQPMVSCCSPNPVGLADGCYFWCEHPASRSDFQAWGSCLRTRSNMTRGMISGMHEAGAARLETGASKKMAVVLLAGLIGSAFTWF
ncbi:oxidoreductase family protein [Apiospora rasikravindrae]|uniref:Oxidoreductase family protein n=1 Tax=Apiospora rasikravindrae TaxID=990691 RepID=A0ABR1SCV1_9PEZI